MKVCSPLFAVAIAAAVYAPHTSATECSKLCTDGSTTCTDLAITATTKSVSAPTVACDYASGQQYLSSLKVSSVGNAVITVALKNGANAVVDGVTKTGSAPTVTGGTDMCYLEFANAGKGDSLTADVSFDVSCASGTTCAAKYAATWACQRDPALCALECDDADPACMDQTIDIGGKLELTKTEDCPTFNYLKSLKIGSKSKKNIAVTFDGASARVPKAKVDSCYFSYGQIPANPTTLLKNVKATVKCADASAACTVQASPTWACDAPVCGKTIDTGGTAQTINAGANFAISKPSSKTCASGEIAYPENLIIGGAFTAYSVGVSFNNGLKPTPTDSSGDCYFAYGPNPVGSSPVSSDVAVTVTCKDPTKPCKIQYKLDSWKCYAPVCQDSCTAGTCKTGSVTAAGGKVAISATAASPACPSGAYQYISALKASADTGDAIVVTFKDGTTALSPVPTATQNKTSGINTNPCSWTYTDVGKTAALGHDVSAEITCKDPATASCAFKYDVTWACQRDPALCAMEAAGSDQAIDMGKSVELTTTAECPTFNYLKSLKVGSKVKEDIKVTFTGGGVAPTASPKVDSCYFEYGQTPTDLTALTASVKATVACVSTTAGCTVQAVPEWACTVSQCAKLVTGGTDTPIDVAKTVVVAKPSGKTCTGGFAYPKDLVVGGKFTSSNVTVTFNNGLTPTPSDSSNDCYFAFADPVGTSTVTSDVTATIACKDATKACTAQVKAPTWDCYTPPDLTKVYTRTEADGKSCQDVSTCASRCAKSYAMGKKDGKVTFVPQLVPADCDCPVLTATPVGDGLTATDSGTTMSATFATATDPMTIEYSADDHKCKYTYTKAAFTNPFAEKVFTFKTVTPNTDDCVLPNDCDYVCAAEMTVAKQGDAIQVWRKPVGDCPCTNTTAYTNDDGETASGSTGPVAYLFDALSATSISLNTTVDGTTCRLMYEEKPAPPPPAPTDPVTDAPKPSTAPTNAPTNAPSPTTPATTTKTGTSAGVSAMGGGAGAGVTTVTLIAAAAGVQAVGLPAN